MTGLQIERPPRSSKFQNLQVVFWGGWTDIAIMARRKGSRIDGEVRLHSYSGMPRTPAAFLSYVQQNDKHDRGRLTEFRERLESEVQMHTGEAFPIFQDRNDIQWGQQWKERIKEGIDASTFLIAIVTPGYLKSPPCRDEFDLFLKRDKKLTRPQLTPP